MKNSYKIILGVASIVVIGAIGTIVFLTRKGRIKTISRQRQEVADEGYEFAYDILYPLKDKRAKAY